MSILKIKFKLDSGITIHKYNDIKAGNELDFFAAFVKMALWDLLKKFPEKK